MRSRKFQDALDRFEVMVTLEGTKDPDRTTLEQLVHEVYADHYNADVTQFFPVLVGIRAGAEPIGAIGARPAAGSLFLENYLDEPIERAAGRALGVQVDRAGIHEVGNLAARTPGTGLLLVAGLACWLSIRRIPWVVFTATQALRNGLRKSGVVLTEVVPADKDRVPGSGAGWGQYYETRPHVCIASIPQVGEAVHQGRRKHQLLPAWDAVAAVCAREMAS